MNATNNLNLNDGSISHSNNYLSLTEYNDNIIIDINDNYRHTFTSLSLLFYSQPVVNSLLTSYQWTLSNYNNNSNCSKLLINNKIKNIGINNGIYTIDYETNIAKTTNGYLSITESIADGTLILDIENKYLNTTTSLSTLFSSQTQTTTLNNTLTNFINTQNNKNFNFALQSDIDVFVNSLPSTYYTQTSANSIFMTKTLANSTFQTKSDMSLYQNLLSNGKTQYGAYLLYNNKIKNLSVANPTINDINLGDGSIKHANDYMSITESGDNTNIIIDIDSKYLNTVTTLSSFYHTQTTVNSLLTSYQPLISTNSTLSFSKGILGGSITNTAILNIKGATTITPALALYSGASNSPSPGGTIFYSGQYNDISLCPGDWGGSTRINNLCSYNAIVIGNGAANTTALTPAVLKNIVCKQGTSTFPSGTYYGIDITSVYNALAGLTFVVNPGSTRCNNIEGLLALCIANLQYIFTNLKTAGIAGFTTY